MRRGKERIFDEYLAGAARAGERAAFERLARRWHPKLIAHAWRLIGERELASDIVQDSWADIVKGLKRLDDTAAFPAWAYRIVTRRAADTIRKRQRARKLNNAYAAEPHLLSEDTDHLEADDERQKLRHAMATLPGDQHAVLALFYTQDLTVAEIASALEIPPGTVKTRLMHGRRKLREHLEGEPSDE